jgi:hypothetical protein
MTDERNLIYFNKILEHKFKMLFRLEALSVPCTYPTGNSQSNSMEPCKKEVRKFTYHRELANLSKNIAEMENIGKI